MAKLFLWEGKLLYCGSCGDPPLVPALGGLAVDDECCCGSSGEPGSSSSSAGCFCPTEGENCAQFGCLEEDDPAFIAINGWFATANDAADDANAAGHDHCAGDNCCPDDEPCFIVVCDENLSPFNTPDDCRLWYWQLCCKCCEECGEMPEPAEDDLCTFHFEATCEAGPPTSSFPSGIPGVCHTSLGESGFCTVAQAGLDAMANGFLVECDGDNCDEGCYIITCDDTKCKERFAWLGCICGEGCPCESSLETCDSFGCNDSEEPLIYGWFADYEQAFTNAEDTGFDHCSGPCCPGGAPCFIVDCDPNSPDNTAPNCKMWFWKLCCGCCTDCTGYVSPGNKDTICNSQQTDGCTETHGSSTPVDYDCVGDSLTSEERGSYCDPNDAIIVAKYRGFLVECDGDNCAEGCYVITCDYELCEDRFSWIGCCCGTTC